jgi:hypothetical protein
MQVKNGEPLTRAEAIAFLRSLRGPWLGDGFQSVHRDQLITALEESTPAPTRVHYQNLRDDDGHRYRVPEDQVEAFEAGLDAICEQEDGSDARHDACANFDNAFGQYRY